MIVRMQNSLMLSESTSILDGGERLLVLARIDSIADMSSSSTVFIKNEIVVRSLYRTGSAPCLGRSSLYSCFLSSRAGELRRVQGDCYATRASEDVYS